METLTWIFSIETRVGTLFGWPLSLVELLAILSGVLSVWYAARRNIFTWVTGLVNEGLFFLVFYQVQLYSDMALQVFFAVATLYGWYHWRVSDFEKTPPRSLGGYGWIAGLFIIALATLLLGNEMASAHAALPNLFKLPAAYPFTDAFTASASVVATVLLARGVIESWVIWIVIDVVSIGLYFNRGIPFMGVLYMLFLVLATVGLVSWAKARRNA